MKRHLLYYSFPLVALAALIAGCNQSADKQAAGTSDSFHIDGFISGADSGWVFLRHIDTTGNVVADSAAIVRDSFHFKGSQAEPTLYTLFIKGEMHQRPANFFVENSEIKFSAVKDSLDAAVITGSHAQDAYEKYLAELKPVKAQMDSLGKQYEEAYSSKNQALMDRLNARYDALDSMRNAQIAGYVHANPASAISAWAITRNFLYSPDAEQLNDLYSALDPAVQKTSYGKKIKKALEIAKKLATGKPAPDFTQNDVNGKPVSLSDFKGKYVLVDFWASWCGPCRAENPNVVKAYNKYKNKNFTVLGVSLDDDKDSWLKAIKADHLDWTQVSDLKGWKNAVAQQYGIRAIPANFLIDDKGIIVGHDLRGKKLEDKLASLLH